MICMMIFIWTWQTEQSLLQIWDCFGKTETLTPPYPS